ncbi:MAG: heavy-metal-associated domain-containing protein [Firmicutes bacterium]|nr:heavy-metal-associated domain-containing protein [Bacillota bacterium]
MYKVTAGIEGMMCGMCESHIQDAIRKAFNVKSVKASKGKKNAVIICENPISEEEMHAAIDPTGYELVSVTCEPYEKKGFHLFG